MGALDANSLSEEGLLSQKKEVPADQEVKDKEVAKHFLEMLEYFSCYVDAKVGEAKLSLKNDSFKLVWALLILLWMSSAFFISFCFLFYGLASALGEGLELKYGLPYICVGGGGLLGVFLFLKFKFYQIKKESLQQAVKKYEQELAKQRQKFGHDMLQSSATK